MKVRHFNTAFRASLLLFVAFSSSVALSDGTCYLTQYASGEYVIRCEGDGVWINYVDHTNEVYVIENCATLKANLLAKVDEIANDINTAFTDYDVESYIDELDKYQDYISDLDGTYDDMTFANDVQNLRSAYQSLRDSVYYGAYPKLFSDVPEEKSLRTQILGIECGSCSTNSAGGSCCDVDLTPILSQMNLAHDFLVSITNCLGSFVGGNNTARYFRNESWTGGSLSIGTALQPLAVNANQISLVNMLKLMHTNLAYTQASLNNYLYQLTQFQLPNISNNLEIVMSTTTNFYKAATNHFSLFSNMIFQDSPLIDYSQQSTFDSYYDFLTNHYVKVSFGQYDSLVGDEKAKTNWFSRIETLLAALVFNDSDGTNTVDDTYGQDLQNNLINSLDGMNQTSTTQVNLMSNMGDNLLASLRSLNSSFSSAVSMPGEVKLATVGQDNSMQSNIIKFQSSEISQFVEVCRCATTLAWCFGGIWLLFLFVSWSIKTSYSLCVFCWSVVSAIFGGGKT